MRPLAYYRGLEIEEGGRGDRWDGVLRYAPADGLSLNMEDGRTIKLTDYSFNASVRQDEIFVWCASMSFSPDVAKTFGEFCVELDPEIIVDRLRRRAHQASSLDYENILSREVDYRPVQRIPLGDWALPEKVALIKPHHFSAQNEYRIAVGKRGALAVENVALTISSEETPKSVPLNNSKILLRLGNLEEHSTLHTF